MDKEKDKVEEKMKFEDEVAEIFKLVFMRQVDITTKGYQKIREVMMQNTQELLKQALKRAIRRQASLNSLEMPDLLHAIDKRGQKYKLKIGKTFVAASGFGDFGERKYIMNYEDEGDEDVYDNEK